MHKCSAAFLTLFFFFPCLNAFTYQTTNSSKDEPKEFNIIRHAYPDVKFEIDYDKELSDWKILISSENGGRTRKTTLYWANGRFLPVDKRNESADYWPILYTYEKDIPDPKNFTKEDIEKIRKSTDSKNRREEQGTPLYFFNAIYDASSRVSTESHIKKITFLGKTTNAHERLRSPLAKVESKIRLLAKINPEVKKFVDTLSKCDSYNWREIGDRKSRSFHSYGIAFDILPKGWGQKNIYWAWRRDIDPKNWMLLPLDKRWMPPLPVIKAFESEGFIWGGKWMIWDNMHFEYHPELIKYNHIR